MESTTQQYLKFLPQSNNQTIQHGIRISSIKILDSIDSSKFVNQGLNVPDLIYHGHSELSSKLTKILINHHDVEEKNRITACDLLKQSLPCVDSNSKHLSTYENFKRRIKKLTINFEPETLYILLFDISERLSKHQPIDPQLEKMLIKKLQTIPLDSLNPSILSTIEEIKRTNQLTVLKKSNQLKSLEIIAHRAGFGFTLFLLIQYISNSNIQGVGLNALNLWIMPVVGTALSQKILNLGKKYQWKTIKNLIPSIGRGFGNILSIVGLAMGIHERLHAVDPIDQKIANLHIISNAVFIIAEVPHIIIETMMIRGIRILPVFKWWGPIATVVTGIVMIGSHLIGIHLQVEKLSTIIELTKQEKLDTYLSLLLIGKIPNSLKTIHRIQQIYQTYISNVLDALPPRRTIAITLNPWIVHKIQWVECIFKTGRFRIGAPTYESKDIVTKILMNKTVEGVIKNSYDRSQSHVSRFIPKSVKNYNILCGPAGDKVNIETTENPNPRIYYGPCDLDENTNDFGNSFVDQIHLEQNDNCRNMIVYENTDANVSQSLLIYASSDLSIELNKARSIELIFYGNNINIDDQSHSIGTNHYYFNNPLETCKINKLGTNYFHMNFSRFNCDLIEESNNLAVIKGRFEDGKNLDTIVGSDNSDFITAKFANYVDGKSGNDTIVAGNATIVRGYLGDSIKGNPILILPFFIHEIVLIVIRDRIEVCNETKECIAMDRNTTMITPDRYFILPSKINEKGIVEEVVVEKFITHDFSLDNELNGLRGLKNPHFRMTKRASGERYDIVLGHVIRNVFISGQDHRNYYWEADTTSRHFYILRGKNVNVTVSQGNGLLDLQGSIDDLVISKGCFGQLTLRNDQLNVTLLSNLKDVAVTFDGNIYYKIVDGQLKRDHCYDGIPVKGRVTINVVHLLDRPRCFKFADTRVTFFKWKSDLLLITYKTILRLIDYYSHVIELAIEWGSETIVPDQFRLRAETPASLKFYEIDHRGMMIYHNQPEDVNDIGFIHMRYWSVLNCLMKLRDNVLYLYHKNKSIVRVENWSTNPSGRKMMFYFEDAFLFNGACVISNCDGADILYEFDKEKLRVRGERFDTVTSGAATIGRNSVEYGIDIGPWLANNFGLALLLVGNFFHRRYPLPRSRRQLVGENLAIGMSMIETLKSTANEFRIFMEDVDFFEIYQNVTRLVNNDRYDRVFETLYSIGQTIGSNNKEFINRLERNLNQHLTK